MEAVVRAMGISLNPAKRLGRNGKRRNPSKLALGAGSPDTVMNAVYGRNRDRFQTLRSTVIEIRRAVRFPVNADSVPVGRVARSASGPVAGPFDRSRPGILHGPHQAEIAGKVTGRRHRWRMDRTAAIEDPRRTERTERGQGRGPDSVPAAPAGWTTA